MIEECHRGRLGGHFSADRVFKSLISQWWWEGMYKDVYLYVKNCPECAIVSGGGKVQRPPLSNTTSILDPGNGHYGFTQDHKRKPICFGLSRLFD